MRSVTYSMGVSLDDYIVGPSGDFDWTEPDHDSDMAEEPPPAARPEPVINADRSGAHDVQRRAPSPRS